MWKYHIGTERVKVIQKLLSGKYIQHIWLFTDPKCSMSQENTVAKLLDLGVFYRP